MGAGRGRLLRALAERGHEATGIEPSPSAAAVAGSHPESGLARIERVPVESAVVPPRSADAVVLWHVLEHLRDPRAALSRIRGWLAPGGRIVIAVPNRESLQARIAGDAWFHQDVPRHLTQFTVAGLHALLRSSGYSPGRTRHLMLDQNPHGMWLSLLNRMTRERDVPFRLLKGDLRYARRRDALRDGLVVATAGVVLLPVALLLELAAGAARRGGTVVVHARLAEGGSPRG